MEAAAAEPSGLDPLPDDLMPDAAWVRARGWSPLEFLVYAYRNPWLKISDREGKGIRDITGTIILERNRQRRTIAIDDAWLREMSAAASH